MILNSFVRALAVSAGAFLVSSAAAASAAFAADTVIAPYEIDNPQAGPIALNYFQFGYTNPGSGEFEPLTGNRIVSSRVTVNFRPGLVDNGSGQMVPFDVNHLELSMVVPVILDDQNGTELFHVLGSDLVQTAPGTWTYELVTDAFNGEIRGGRFSLDIEAFDQQGDPVPLAGEFFGGSGFFYTVAVPEPAAGLVALPAIAALVGRRRRA